MSALSDLFTDIATEIRGKTGETGTMKPAEFPDKIAGIETGVEVTPDYVGFATFMNGDVELYKMPFIKGYDCPNPLTEGLIETPTKESTVSTNYTYSGWDNNLTDLTEDVVVNAVFSQSVRYYTVTFYDDDGTTVLATQEVQYGALPDYVPSKTGFSFKGWTTDLAPVRGDTSYVAVWGTVITFATSSWSDISDVCEAGEAEDYFALGDTRTEYLTKDGTSYACKLKIIGFSHDDKSDGSGKAGITVAFFNFPSTLSAYKLGYWTSSSADQTHFESGETRAYVTAIQSYLPSQLQSVIKTVSKSYSQMETSSLQTYSKKLFVLSINEAGWEIVGVKDGMKATGTVYQYFEENSFYGDKKNANTIVINENNISASGVFSRDVYYISAIGLNDLSLVYLYPSTPSLSRRQKTDNNYHFAMAFCV